MKKNWKKLFREDLERDADQIMEEVNSDPTLKDVKAPDEIHERLMRQIHGHTTAEEKELIALGRIYKKRRRQSRYVAVAAAMVAVFAIGITSLGGPERIIQTMRRMVGEREQTRVNVQGDQITSSGISDEEKAYQTIKDKFGVEPVRFHRLPNNMVFAEAVIEEETQNARLYYEDGKGKSLSCTILFNYRTESAGVDVEDSVVREYNYEVDGNPIVVKLYAEKEDMLVRWRVEFQYQKIQYFIVLSGLTDVEMEEFVKNLYFS